MGQSFNLARLLASAEFNWSHGYKLLEQFEVSPRERAFARAVLTRKRNFWLFRCNQRRYCGDFMLVDMSSPSPSLRRVLAVELKLGAPLQVGARPGRQLANWRLATAEIGKRHAIIDPACDAELLIGSSEQVLAHLGAE